MNVSRYGSKYTLHIGKVNIDIEERIAFQIVLQDLPEEEIVWHINTKKGDIFFSDEYPEWSIVPNPRKWFAGNIYHSREDAITKLHLTIQAEIDKLTRRHQELIRCLKEKLP